MTEAFSYSSLGKHGKGGISLSFYTYSYIEQVGQASHTVWYVISFLALAALFVVSIKYLRSSFSSRYRDLVVLLFLAVIFLGGMQYGDYNRMKSDREQTSRMVQFVQSLSKDLDVPADDIKVNSTNLKQGMLVDVEGTFYVIHFNADYTSFQYERTHLLRRDIQIVDKED